MTKKIPVLFLSLFFICALPVRPTYAADMWSKLGRGVGNITFGIFELVHTPAKMAEKERWPVAAFGGIPKGFLMVVARELVGAYETLTFPIPVPAHYRVIMEPEFVISSY